MTVHIAIPEPTSSDSGYNQRSLPAYLAAIHSAGATPIVVPLHERQDRVARLLAGVQGILLPGSRFDIDPQRYGESAIPECGDADPARTAVDELLLQDGFSLRKPILAICHGMQSLNVWCNGSLVQDLQTSVNHRPGREVVNAHGVCVSADSRLGELLADRGEAGGAIPMVNSSHHQAVRVAGDKLLVVARAEGDDVIESVELDSADHFVLGVQWHPERTYTASAFSRAIFGGFVRAAAEWVPRQVDESVVKG
jgi:putative glutamine amidotransferase